MTELVRVFLDELAGDPVALERLRALVALEPRTDTCPAPAYTVASLAAELGRSERSIRGAIARGELVAVKRGRGYVIARDAVAAWAAVPTAPVTVPRRPRAGARSGVMARALGR